MIPRAAQGRLPPEIRLRHRLRRRHTGHSDPPSVPMVNLSVAMPGSSVAKQFTAGFVPGVLLALIWCVMVVFYCRKAKIDDRKYYTRAESVKAFKNGILAILYPVIVLGSIYGGFATPHRGGGHLHRLCLPGGAVLLQIHQAPGPAQVRGPGGRHRRRHPDAGGRREGHQLVRGRQPNPRPWPPSSPPTSPAALSSLILLIVIFLVLGMFLDIIPLTYILGPHPGHHPDQLRRGLCTVRHHLYPLLPAGQPDAPFGMCLFMTMGVAKESLPNVAKGAVPFIVSMVAFALVCAFVPQISMWLPCLLGFT